LRRFQRLSAAHVPFFIGNLENQTGRGGVGEQAALRIGNAYFSRFGAAGTGVMVDPPLIDPPLGGGTTGEFCFAGPPTALCFVGPPTELCARAGLEKALPHTQRKMTDITALHFIGDFLSGGWQPKFAALYINMRRKAPYRFFTRDVIGEWGTL
jgi:hypothetical protein